MPARLGSRSRCQLIRYGIDFTIIDKNTTTTPHSKAIGVQARTLELYEQIGLADKLIALGAKAERARMFVGGKLRGQLEFSDIGKGLSPYPFLLIVEQGMHETLLYDHIRSHGNETSVADRLLDFTKMKRAALPPEHQRPDGKTEQVRRRITSLPATVQIARCVMPSASNLGAAPLSECSLSPMCRSTGRTARAAYSFF